MPPVARWMKLASGADSDAAAGARLAAGLEQLNRDLRVPSLRQCLHPRRHGEAGVRRVGVRQSREQPGGSVVELYDAAWRAE